MKFFSCTFALKTASWIGLIELPKNEGFLIWLIIASDSEQRFIRFMVEQFRLVRVNKVNTDRKSKVPGRVQLMLKLLPAPRPPVEMLEPFFQVWMGSTGSSPRTGLRWLPRSSRTSPRAQKPTESILTIRILIYESFWFLAFHLEIVVWLRKEEEIAFNQNIIENIFPVNRFLRRFRF